MTSTAKKHANSTTATAAAEAARAEADQRTNPRPQGAEPERMELLFNSLRDSEQESVSTAALSSLLEGAGLRSSDPRLAELHRRILSLSNARSVPRLDRQSFEQVLAGGTSLVERTVRGELVIPDFAQFSASIERTFESVRGNDDGDVARYIPQLARVPASRYALGVCTVDGQRLGLGDADERFCVQSSCKPINYCLALQDVGRDRVHEHIGFEPSGRSFNELSLNDRGRPHNPMINAGAIMACSLIGQDLQAADRFDHVTDLWTRMAGGVRPGFDNSVYLSERKTADRNFALAYFMRENQAFPQGTDLHETLEFYFQCCSLEMTANDFSVVAATLANGGVCPLTEERVLDADVVRKCLTLMESSGMYDFSGEWAFTVGLPAKSGVSGIILVVIPDTMGFAIWSPRLDKHGNSVRGVSFCRELVKDFNFHHFDTHADGLSDKPDPRHEADHGELLSKLLWAASKDDIVGIRRAEVRGLALGAADYDGRTALHLAASEGRIEAIRYLLLRGVDLQPRDRWGGTPIDDARREGHDEVAALLESALPQASAKDGC